MSYISSPCPSKMLDDVSQSNSLKVQHAADGFVRTLSKRFIRQEFETDDGHHDFRLSSSGSAVLSETHVLVLYTGGTIGMELVDGHYQPRQDFFIHLLRHSGNLNDQDYVNANYPNSKVKPNVLPPIKDQEVRLVYWIAEYEPLLDSSDMTYDDWIRIAKDIKRNYNAFDGFVVLHGTDTLAYTASALSFILEGLKKPVVLTGSQIPLAEVRSDGRENFIGALVFAGCYKIPEVMIYFGNNLMRGNRCTKADNSSLGAFESPNFSSLANVGINVKLDLPLILASHPSLDLITVGSSVGSTSPIDSPRDTSASAFGFPELVVCEDLVRDIHLMRIFPSMPIKWISSFLEDESCRGVVLQTYGSGNFPTRRQDVLALFKKATDRGMIIVNCSQCLRGQVTQDLYTTGSKLTAAGVISASDMTTEAALTKLAYVLGKDWSLEQRKMAMKENLRGELTPLVTDMKLRRSEHDHVMHKGDRMVVEKLIDGTEKISFM